MSDAIPSGGERTELSWVFVMCEEGKSGFLEKMGADREIIVCTEKRRGGLSIADSSGVGDTKQFMAITCDPPPEQHVVVPGRILGQCPLAVCYAFLNLPTA